MHQACIAEMMDPAQLLKVGALSLGGVHCYSSTSFLLQLVCVHTVFQGTWGTLGDEVT